MSNYLSVPLKYSDTIDTSATEIFAKVATLKQQKYDTTQNSIQNTIDQYGAMSENLRAKGQEYLAGKLEAVTQIVNSSGQNRDLSKSGVARAINNQISSIVRDPILINEIAQSQKIASFNKEVGQLKAKESDKYSDGNYQDALNQAGVNQFMNGETDQVGNLVYHEYRDIPAILNKNAQEFRDKNATEQYLGTVHAGDANHPYDKIQYGKRLSTDQIQAHLMSNLDSKDIAQIQINARLQAGGTDANSINTYMIETLTDENAKNSEVLAKGLAQLNSLPEDQKAQYSEQIALLKKNIEDNNNKIKLGTFTTNDLYNSYANNTIRNIAGQYDVDVITKFDTDKMAYEMMKDDRDYALKLDEINFNRTAKAQEQADKQFTAQQATLGSQTDVITPTEDKPKSDFTTIREQTHQSAVALDAYLVKTVPEYKNMNAKQRWTYKQTLDAYNPKVKGNTAEYRNLVEDFQTAQGQYATIVGEVQNGIKETTTNVFNQMLAGKGTSDLNIKNLATTMPLTATMLGRKDIASFNNLSPSQKLGVMAEFASSNLQYNDNLSGDLRSAYERSVTGFKSKLEGLKTADSKLVLSTIKNSASTEERSGIASIYAKNIPYGLFALEKKIIAPVANIIDYGVNRLFENKSIAEQRYKEREKTDASVISDYAKSRRNVEEVNQDLFTTDSNISEIQARDLKGRVDAKEQFNSENERLSGIITKKASEYTKNINENKAYTFSTADKGQAPTARALRAIVLNSADNPQIPEGFNDYTIQREGSGFRIGFTKKEGKETLRSSVFVSKLPDNLAQSFNQTQQSWKNSPLNPNIKLVSQAFTPETDPIKRNAEVKNISQNLTDVLSQQMIALLETKPSQSPFKTTIEFGQEIRKNYGNDFYQQYGQQIEAIINNKYTASPKVTSDANNPFWVDIQYVDPISGAISAESQPLSGREKNESSFYLQYANMIYKLKTDAIEQLHQTYLANGQ